jgi:parallel beta-helix repeat protein
MNIKRVLIFSFFAYQALTANLWAATYYVANTVSNSSDSNAGTETQPWKTIQHGVDIAAAGDTVYVKDGIYYEAVKMKRSGSAGKYITFRNFPGHNPAVDGSKTTEGRVVSWSSDGIFRHYIIWDGIEVRNSKRYGMWISGDHNIIRNCKIHHNGTLGSSGNTGLQAKFADYIIISNNDIYNNGWNGLSVENSHYATIESNLSHDNTAHVGINVFPAPGGPQDMQVGNNIRSNILFNNNHGIYSRYQVNNEISNNLIYNSIQGGIFFHYEAGSSTTYNAYTKIYNNTIVNCKWQGITNQGTVNYLTIVNNIIVNSKISLSGSGNVFDNNLLYGTSYSGSGSNNVSGDPRFVGQSKGDYSIASGSPAIDKGKDLTKEGITRDIVGKTRPQGNGFDIGAYEYGGVTKNLGGLTISGPAGINESSSGTYAATATWSDGSSSVVTPLWSENSTYATISAGGVLTASSVTADQPVTVSAEYTTGGVTKTASKSVTIANVSLVKTLSGLTINGPSSVEESSSGTYAAMATWSDGATSAVTPLWSENSTYTTISAGGVMTTLSVTADQPVTVSAAYTSGGVTKSAAKSVAITNVSPPSPPPPVEIPPGAVATELGPVTAPMQVVFATDVPGGSYVETTARALGSAVYNVNIVQPGTYGVIAYVYAADANSDSFLVKIDNGLADIWDMNPQGDPALYGVWRKDAVTGRGAGTFDAPQFNPFAVQLAAGSHTLTLSGREPNAKLAYAYLIESGAPVKNLSGLTINGPSSIEENSSGTYTATAAWSDGSASPVTPLWSENSTYATISSGGVLTALAVTADQSVTVSAGYTSGGVTKTASKSVNITDVPPPSPEPPGAEGQPSPVLLFSAEAGALSPETMAVVSSAGIPGGSYITPSSSTSSTAVYDFDIDQAGTYKIVAEVFAADNASDSFLVKIDNNPEDIWDLNPEGDPALYGVWRQDAVTARGTGMFDAPQFDPLLLQLAAGQHTIAVSGRELNSRLAYFYLIMAPGATALIEAESGTLTAPMQVGLAAEASGGAYVETPTSNAGRAVYGFNIVQPGPYMIVAKIYGANAGSDSLVVKIDNGPEDIWDFNPKEDPALSGVWRQDAVTGRGKGTFDVPQFNPLTVQLAAGPHSITFSGRESNARLDNFYLMRVSSDAEIIKIEID